MRSLYLLYLRAVAVFLKMVVICILPINVLGADMVKLEGPQLVGTETLDNPSFDDIREGNGKIYMEAKALKLSYKSSEPIALKISILNSTQYRLFYMDIMPEFDFMISIREKNRGNLLLNKYGAQLKQGKVPLSSIRVYLKPGEVGNYDVILNKIFDIDAGSYEVLVQRKLFLPIKRSLIDQLFHLNKSAVVDLRTKSVRFDVIK